MDVGPEDFRAIAVQIAEGRAIKLRGKGRQTSTYLVTVQGSDAVVVFNRKAKVVITFLPLDWERKHE